MMRNHYCLNCMRELEPGAAVCPHCGSSKVSQPDYALAAGTLLHGGRYLVGKCLGKGGFGLTYAGMDLVLLRKVAIKEYYPASRASRTGNTAALNWNTNEENRRKGCSNFIREAQLMVKWEEIPNIVKALDTFEDDTTGTAYIIMDFIEGQTLQARLAERGVMDWKECLSIFSPVVRALNEAHSRGLYHRDISPDNIMIDAKGKVWLLDLGAGVSQDSLRVFKRGFSPLELHTDTGITGAWTDVYSLCASMFYCMTGKMIPAATSRVSNQKLFFPERIPPEVAELLKRGLSLRPEDRFQTAAELLEAMNAVPESGGDPPPSLIARAIQWIFGHKVAVAATVIAVVTVIGVTWALTHRTYSVEILGISNANLYNQGGLAANEEYMFYSTADNNLYRRECLNDMQEILSTDNDLQIQGVEDSHYISNISLVGSSVYFAASTNGSVDGFHRMNLDGSDLKSLWQSEGNTDFQEMQYVKLSDGQEYFYFLLNEEGNRNTIHLYRYCIGKKETEEILKGRIVWYNLYENALYYTEMDDSGSYILKKAKVNGTSIKTLNSDINFVGGFVDSLWDGDSGHIIGLAYEDNRYYYVGLNLNGEKDGALSYLSDLPSNGTIGFGDGWLYYTGGDEDDNNTIHRIRSDGTRDQIVTDNHSADRLCYQNGKVWFLERVSSESEFGKLEEQAYLMPVRESGNGEGTLTTEEDIVPLGEKHASWGLNIPNGWEFQYVINHDKEVTITGYTGDREYFEIPETIKGKPVTAIDAEAFRGNTKLEVIGLPSSVKSIGKDAFYGCENLRFVGLSNGLETIEQQAFMRCPSLSMVKLPDSLTTIGDKAFAESGLTEVEIPANVSEIREGAFAVFSHNHMSEFEVSEDNACYTAVDGVLYRKTVEKKYSSGKWYTVQKLELAAYPSGREDESFEIPGNTTAILSSAFAHCSEIKELKVPDSVERIEDNAFFATTLTEIEVGRNCVTSKNLGGNITVNHR